MIEDILQFGAFLEKFRSIKRTVLVPSGERDENDTEHSYMLAMLAWYICVTEKLSLDVDKVIRYALVHDLVEVYAGDIGVYTGSEKDRQGKSVREQESLERIRNEWAAFPDMVCAMSSYMEHADAESRFVYALDKLQPMLVGFHGDGKAYKKLDVSLETMREVKAHAVAKDPTVKKYFDDLITIFEEHHDRLFNSQT